MTVFKVTDIAWETFYTNTPLDGCPTNQGSLRIFPDKQSFNDEGTMRSCVWVRGHITPAPGEHPSNPKVYLTSFDVDDPSADGWPVDVYPLITLGDEGTIPNAGPDNSDVWEEGNTGAFLALPGLPPPPDVPEADPSGLFMAVFQVTMQPGDNFAIGATTTPQLFENRFPPGEIDRANAAEVEALMPGAPGGSDLLGAAKVTQMLTVWRRLWIEQDTMARPPHGDPVCTAFPARITPQAFPHIDFEMPGLDPGQEAEGVEIDVFEGGRILFDGLPESYTVMWNTFTSADINGLPPDSIIGEPCTLYDDDDPSVLPHYPMPTSAPYAEAYIEIVEAGAAYRDVVPFDPYLDWFQLVTGDGTWNDGIDLDSNDPQFWVCPIVGAFQPSESVDSDPDQQGGMAGATGVPLGHAAIFLEVIRENSEWKPPGLGGDPGWVAAHECGHVGGLSDNNDEPNLMNADDPNEHFLPWDISWLRQTPCYKPYSP